MSNWTALETSKSLDYQRIEILKMGTDVLHILMLEIIAYLNNILGFFFLLCFLDFLGEF